MRNKIYYLFTLIAMLSTNSMLAVVNESSSAYKAGNLVGKIFLAVLVFLILKKFLFKK